MDPDETTHQLNINVLDYNVLELKKKAHAHFSSFAILLPDAFPFIGAQQI